MLLANGKTVSKKIDGLSLLSTMLDADLNPGLAAELPAVVHAARLGNVQPLLRLVTCTTAVGHAVDRPELRAVRGDGLP